MTLPTPSTARGAAPADTSRLALIWTRCPDCGLRFQTMLGFDIVCKGTIDAPVHSLTIPHKR